MDEDWQTVLEMCAGEVYGMESEQSMESRIRDYKSLVQGPKQTHYERSVLAPSSTTEN